jgi:Ca2+-binding RTX toxin-like protein
MTTNNVSFTEITFSPTGNQGGYEFPAIGDFNGDGQPDAVVPFYASKRASVLLNDGKGGFNAPTTITWDASVSSFTLITPIVNDFNGDGKADLIFGQSNSSTETSSISVLLGDGSGNFSAPTTFASDFYTLGVVADDFNGDGKLDLLATSFNDNRIWLGNGDGSFKTPNSVQGQFGGAKVGDFNGDGKRDLVGINGRTISLSLGNGDGSFGSPSSIAIEGVDKDADIDSISTGDFNGDSKLDVAVATYKDDRITGKSSDHKVSILLNNGNGGFTTQISFAVGDSFSPVAVGDFNGDGKADIATSETSNSDVKLTGTFVRLNDGSGSFSSPTKVSSLTGNLSVGDFNKDGKADLTGFFKDKIGTILLSVPDPKPLPTPVPAPAAPIGTTAAPLAPIDFKKGGKGKGLVVKGNDKKTKLVGKSGNDKIMGGKKNDRLMGNAGDDLLNGGAGNDKIMGGAGNDVLVGGKGKDMLTGGTGRDTFVFNMVSDAMDQISDFEVGQDLIDLRGIFQQAAFQKAGSSNFDRFQQFVKVEQMGAVTKVSIDADGVGAGTTFTPLAMLNGATAPVNSQSFVVG